MTTTARTSSTARRRAPCGPGWLLRGLPEHKKKPNNHDLLEILKREADKDLDFATFLIKYLYAVHQVTPPASPRLETDIKEIWGPHTGKRGVEALTAKEEDMLDEVLGKPPVVRCRVCHKPSETGVHPECTRRAIVCTMFPDHTGKCRRL